MNAPTIFGAVMAGGLLLLLNMKGKLRIPAAVFGFLGLLLTMSRSSWLSLAAGGIFLTLRMGMRERARIAGAVVGGIVFLGCLTVIPAVNDLVWQRIQTFSDPSHDVSFGARLEGHQQALKVIGNEPFGEGLGSLDTEHNTEGDDDIIGPHDSTPLEFLYSLGWIGTFIYSIGLGALALQLIRAKCKDPFCLSSTAILLGFVAECLLNSVMLGVLGFMVWTFAAMNLAAAENEGASALAAEAADRRTVRFVAA
jgi:O-antigen ligase